jgi:hypothetical protein
MTVTCLGSRECCLLACDEPCITDKSLTKCMGQIHTAKESLVSVRPASGYTKWETLEDIFV